LPPFSFRLPGLTAPHPSHGNPSGVILDFLIW
jgi:hypothetical protein